MSYKRAIHKVQRVYKLESRCHSARHPGLLPGAAISHHPNACEINRGKVEQEISQQNLEVSRNRYANKVPFLEIPGTLRYQEPLSLPTAGGPEETLYSPGKFIGICAASSRVAVMS